MQTIIFLFPILGFAIANECPKLPIEIQTEILHKHPSTGENGVFCKVIPNTVDDVVTLANWAGEHKRKIRAIGRSPHFRKRRSTTDNKIDDEIDLNEILVSTEENLNSIKVNMEDNTVTFQTGATLAELLKTLSENKLGLLAAPNVHNISMGGVLSSTGGHGDGGETGTISNLILELSIIGYDPLLKSYQLITLTRNGSDDIAALLAGNDGRTFIISSTILMSPMESYPEHKEVSDEFTRMHSISILTAASDVERIKERIDTLLEELPKCKGSMLVIRTTPVDNHTPHGPPPLLSKARVDDKYPEFDKVIWVDILTSEEGNEKCSEGLLSLMRTLLEKEYEGKVIIRGDEVLDNEPKALEVLKKFDAKNVFGN